MRILELFSGSGSVGRIFEGAGWEVTSVDVLKSCAGYECTLCMSVLDIKLDQWPEGYWDVIWASPPCTEFSRAKSTGIRDTEKASALVRHTLALIQALKPKWWFLENPASGGLKHEEYMAGIPFADTSYCRWSDWGYRKNTRVWSNALKIWKPLPVCARDCPNMAFNAAGRLVHRTSAQKGPSRGTAQDRCFTSEELYRIPPKLVGSILEAVS